MTATTPGDSGLSPDGSWYTDAWAEDLLWSVGVRAVLRDVNTGYQRLRVLDTRVLGRMLVLDEAVQVAEADEAAYHELLVHPGLCRAGARRGSRRVLVVGGGDGGAAREALRHDDVVHVDLVELDPAVTQAARELLPTVWTGLDDDPRLHVHHEDGVAFVARDGEGYDLVVVDSTDPVGPGAALFSEAFYRALRGRVREGGAVAVQAGSWFFLPQALRLAHRGLSAAFERAEAYQCWSAIYPGGLWNLVLATTGDEPGEPGEILAGCSYYDAAVHRAAFALPPAARAVLEK